MDTRSALKHLFFLFFSFLLLSISVQSRYVTNNTANGIFDGFSVLHFKKSSSDSCEQTYGFMPCTTAVPGNIFLVIVYGYLMFLAAQNLSNGSELLLEILGTNIVGGLFLPMLGALPDSILILVSGLSGSKEKAQSQVIIGMGLLAGSAVILLTLLWGSCLLVAKTDIKDSTTIDLQVKNGFNLTRSGVSVDIWTCYGAMIMVVSILPYIIVQLPQILHFPSDDNLAVLVSLIVALGLLVSYCAYQVLQPTIQIRRLDFIKQKHVIAGALKHLQNHQHGKLFNSDGEIDHDFLKKLFTALDVDGSLDLSARELTALIIGMDIQVIDLDHDYVVKKIMRDFDTSCDGKISMDEFIAGITKWLQEAQCLVKVQQTSSFLDQLHNETSLEHNLLYGYPYEEVGEGPENVMWLISKASLLILLGVAVAAAFADPLVNTVSDLSNATGIPSFFISFVALPFLMNSSEATSALMFASRKKNRTSSLTFSEIYGSVTIHNLLCLAVFLGIVYVRDLTWNFSAEVLIITIVCIVMGLFASFRRLFPLWTCSIAYALYPISLLLVYVLDYGYGWS